MRRKPFNMVSHAFMLTLAASLASAANAATTLYRLDPGFIETAVEGTKTGADPASSANPLDQLATAGPDAAHTTFSHLDAGFELDANFVRGGTLNDGAWEIAQIEFTPTRDLAYAIAAQFSASANTVVFEVSLQRSTTTLYSGSGSTGRSSAADDLLRGHAKVRQGGVDHRNA